MDISKEEAAKLQAELKEKRRKAWVEQQVEDFGDWYRSEAEAESRDMDF